jgi:hypothetical protein
MIALAFIFVLTFCAQERNRTFTSLRMADFESAASTNSATWAIAAERFFDPTLRVCSNGMQY